MSANTVVAPWAEDVRVLVGEILADGMPADAVDIYKGRNRVTRLERCGRQINIKAFRRPNLINRYVYGNLRKSKARRAFEHAVKLRRLGFDTPEPLAYIERGHGCRFTDSYFLSLQLEGFRDLRVIDDDDDREMLADRLGRLMARLHEAGVWMKDFSQGNILRRRVGEGRDYELYLVDINRMEFGVTSRRKLMENFRTVTDDDSFFRILAAAYARHASLDERKTIESAYAARRRYLRSRRLKSMLH